MMKYPLPSSTVLHFTTPPFLYSLDGAFSSTSSDSPKPPSACSASSRDVTDVFEAFHRDPRQRAKLEAFRIGTLVGYTPSQLVKDFRSLKRELEDQGLFEVGGGRAGQLGELNASVYFLRILSFHWRRSDSQLLFVQRILPEISRKELSVMYETVRLCVPSHGSCSQFVGRQRSEGNELSSLLVVFCETTVTSKVA